jgi:hypothetical protein
VLTAKGIQNRRGAPLDAPGRGLWFHQADARRPACGVNALRRVPLTAEISLRVDWRDTARAQEALQARKVNGKAVLTVGR